MEHFRLRKAVRLLFQGVNHLLDFARGRECAADEKVRDFKILGPAQQYPVSGVQTAPGAAYLLIVMNDRLRRLVMNDKRQVRLVKAHSQRSRCHQRFDTVRQQSILQLLAIFGLPGVLLYIEAAGLEPTRYQLSVADGKSIDYPGTVNFRKPFRQPRQTLRLTRQSEGLQQ